MLPMVTCAVQSPMNSAWARDNFNLAFLLVTLAKVRKIMIQVSFCLSEGYSCATNIQVGFSPVDYKLIISFIRMKMSPDRIRS